ncbi:NUDIX domain-containing protein [Candidatus Woesearchaeota archaeon]|nr:NUDIX domain-containing protein [Candidatus Woesearchaeota archaeon]
MEMLPVVNKKDELIDTTTREICHAKKLRHRAVHIFVFNTKGEILLQKRSSDKDEYPGYYEASVSGHVRKDESYEQAAIREIEEEIGIVVNLDELHERCKFEVLFGQEHMFIQLFVIFTKKNPEINDGEIESMQWISKPALAKEIQKGKKRFTPECLAAFDCFLHKKQ